MTTNIAKRSAKKTSKTTTTKRTSTQAAAGKALNKAVAAAETQAAASLEAWATVLDGRVTGLYPTRTKAREQREEKRIFGEDLGTVRKAMVQLV